MGRALLMTALLAGALSFGSVPARAGVSADVDIRVGHDGPGFASRAPRGEWQSRGEYGNAGGQWDNGGCQSSSETQYRDGGQYGRGWWYYGRDRSWKHGARWGGGRGHRDRWDRGEIDNRGYGRGDGDG